MKVLVVWIILTIFGVSLLGWVIGDEPCPREMNGWKCRKGSGRPCDCEKRDDKHK